ncbi:hypothetical protein GOP47_0004684 [Adiantum capillus-veneris]|uniref:TCP domain-containing protein n=1 Tax=Adiantum capillus-veneris TaxID=13818 RepID=A0A9D4V951_ADICA|nr:hypothetical protein GOP47_0004684 [Adiantum capillus-veneris]
MRPRGATITRGRASAGQESSYEALQSMLSGEYTEESNGARTIRQTGGKDRHSKVFTSRGPRDRRVRLSVGTAIRFYDLQDRLGFEQPSKAVEWLLLHCQPSIRALPQLGTFHRRPHAQVAALPAPQPAALLSDHPSSHNMQAMNHKSSLENMTHYKNMHSQYRFGQLDHILRSQVATLQHQQRMQACLPNGNYSLNTHALYDAAHAQDQSIEEDIPQSSHPSSSGGSSDHPTSLSKASQKLLVEPTTCSSQSIFHSSPSCNFSQADQHALADVHISSFISDRNAAGIGITAQEAHEQGVLDLSQSMNLGASNMMALYGHSSVTDSNTGRLYGTPSRSASYPLIIGNKRSMENMRQRASFIDNSMHGTQTEGILLRAGTASSAEPNKYIDATLRWQQSIGAEANDVAKGAVMSFQMGQGEREDPLSVSNIEDTMQILYGKMGFSCSANLDVSPSESNSNNINSIAVAAAESNYDEDHGKASTDEQLYSARQSFDWALKHALLN